MIKRLKPLPYPHKTIERELHAQNWVTQIELHQLDKGWQSRIEQGLLKCLDQKFAYITWEHYDRIEEYHMAKKGKFRYINQKLSAAEKQSYLIWKEEREGELDDMLNELGKEGYRSSIAWIPEEKRFRAQLTTVDRDDENYNKALQAFAPSCLEVIYIIIFKHFVIHEHCGWLPTNPEDDWG